MPRLANAEKTTSLHTRVPETWPKEIVEKIAQTPKKYARVGVKDVASFLRWATGQALDDKVKP